MLNPTGKFKKDDILVTTSNELFMILREDTHTNIVCYDVVWLRDNFGASYSIDSIERTCRLATKAEILLYG